VVSNLRLFPHNVPSELESRLKSRMAGISADDATYVIFFRQRVPLLPHLL
jgi:hypothetical protein